MKVHFYLHHFSLSSVPPGTVQPLVRRLIHSAPDLCERTAYREQPDRSVRRCRQNRSERAILPRWLIAGGHGNSYAPTLVGTICGEPLARHEAGEQGSSAEGIFSADEERCSSAAEQHLRARPLRVSLLRPQVGK